MAIKIAHEAPNQFFKHVQNSTDYDYCLVHLYIENEKYREHFKNAKLQSREIILDTSIFELGESFDEGEYIKVINELQPTWYIIPDILGDAVATVKKATQWVKMVCPNISFSKPMAVLHGTQYLQLRACYEHYDNDLNIENIAIPFHLPYYQSLIKNPNKDVSNMLGRVSLLGSLLQDGVINVNKKHHLLGVSLPQEGIYYKDSQFGFITSVDSSSPILHGLKNITYECWGLQKKEPTKMFTLIDAEYTNECYECVDFNIKTFKSFFN